MVACLMILCVKSSASGDVPCPGRQQRAVPRLLSLEPASRRAALLVLKQTFKRQQQTSKKQKQTCEEAEADLGKAEAETDSRLGKQDYAIRSV